MHAWPGLARCLDGQATCSLPYLAVSQVNMATQRTVLVTQHTACPLCRQLLRCCCHGAACLQRRVSKRRGQHHAARCCAGGEGGQAGRAERGLAISHNARSSPDGSAGAAAAVRRGSRIGRVLLAHCGDQRLPDARLLALLLPGSLLEGHGAPRWADCPLAPSAARAALRCLQATGSTQR